MMDSSGWVPEYGASSIIGMAVHGNCLLIKSCCRKDGTQEALMAMSRNSIPGPLRWTTEKLLVTEISHQYLLNPNQGKTNGY